MRIRMILLFCALASLCAAPAFAQSAAGTDQKTLFINGVPLANDPIRIKVMNGMRELKSDGRQLPNNNAWETAFNAGDDWISDLPFVIKNASAKEITCVIIFSFLLDALVLQDETHPKPSVLGFTQNRVGQRPEHALHANGRSLPPDSDPPFELAPEQMFTMPIENPQESPALKTRIETRLPISSVKAIHGGIVTVFFADGTRWVSVNHSYSRPAEQPEKWTRISYEEWAGKPKASER